VRDVFRDVISRECERSGAAKFLAHGSAPFMGIPFSFPLLLRSAPLRSEVGWILKGRGGRSPGPYQEMPSH